MTEFSPMNPKFMTKAIELSIKNVESGKGGPFGAVIVREGKIIGEGVNSVTLTNDPTAHAEVMAIRQACKAIKSYNLEDAIIYTSCEPCPMCLSAIYWARIKSIYFGNSKIDAAQIKFDDQFIYQEIAKSHSERKIPCQQIMQKEAQVAFKIWEQKSDKILY